ncbi:cytochrome c oxidase assembly factor 1 homolog [Halichoeres trimaculatus]|uniref:cytochrome c oxidase assembly factor 1 homolog n=1 Tax=Halichoeres trimaculatus TaxID=147232 RepID=UPI003D9E88D7
MKHMIPKVSVMLTLMSGGAVSAVYHLLQRRFTESDYYEMSLRRLENSPDAMKLLGAPPLKVDYIHLSDIYNQVDTYSAQIKIPVSGSRDEGFLCTSSVRNPDTFRWSLKEAVLNLNRGQTINLMSTPPAGQTTEDTQGQDSWGQGSWGQETQRQDTWGSSKGRWD